MASFVFWGFAAVAIGCAVMCISARNPLASALWLVGTLFSLAGLFVLLQAQFIAVIQVLVYAGAIMVLFLFVIMLLNVGRQPRTDMVGWMGRLVLGAVALLLVVQLWVVAQALPPEGVRLAGGGLTPALPAGEGGVVGVIGLPLFREYLVPFEVTAVLLLAAIVGAVVLAKRRL